MEQSTATRSESRRPEGTPEASCPHCGESAEKDQLVCLRCGGRIALDYRRPLGWKLPTAIVAGVALVAAVAFGWALREITDNAKTEVARAPAAKPTTHTTASTPAKRAPAKRKPARRQPAAHRRSAAGRKASAGRRRRAPSPSTAAFNPPGTWPVGKNAYTVVLTSTDNPGSAKDAARAARHSGVPAGYLRTNDYSSLQKGFWDVYGGVYRTRARAEKAAASFAGSFPGTYVQYVNGAKAGKKKRGGRR